MGCEKRKLVSKSVTEHFDYRGWQEEGRMAKVKLKRKQAVIEGQ